MNLPADDQLFKWAAISIIVFVLLELYREVKGLFGEEANLGTIVKKGAAFIGNLFVLAVYSFGIAAFWVAFFWLFFNLSLFADWPVFFLLSYLGGLAGFFEKFGTVGRMAAGAGMAWPFFLIGGWNQFADLSQLILLPALCGLLTGGVAACLLGDFWKIPVESKRVKDGESTKQ